MNDIDDEIPDGFTVTELGVLPDGWRVVPLHEVTSGFQYGLSERASDKGKYPILRMNNINSGSMDIQSLKYLDLDCSTFEKFKIDKDDVLFNRTNSFELVGKTACFDVDLDCTFASYLIRLKPISNKSFGKYIAYYLNLPSSQERLKGLATRGVSQSNISASKLKDFLLPVPPLPEQNKIASVLSSVQEARDKTQSVINALKDLKKSLMKHLFTYGAVSVEEADQVVLKETEIGLIPDNWKLCSVGDLCQSISVGVVVRPASYYVSTGVPAFRSLNIHEDKINANDLVYFSHQSNDGALAKSKLRTGDVLIVRTGYPGTSCVVPPEYDGSNCIDLVIARPKLEVLSSEFLSRFFNSPMAKIQIQGSKTGLAQQHLNVGAVKSTLIPIPPVEEQHKITNILRIADDNVQDEEGKKRSMDNLFKTLLHNLMTGKTRVNGLEV